MLLHQLLESVEESNKESFINKYSNDNYHYVLFSNSEYPKLNETSLEPFPNHQPVYKINYVLKNLDIFDLDEYDYIHIISLYGKGINLDKVNYTNYVRLMLSLGFDIDEAHKLSSNKLHEVLINVLQDHNKGISYVESIKHFPHNMVFLLNNSFSINKTYVFKEEIIENKTPEINMVASSVAYALGTELNSDEELKHFMDHYFWTSDGIEIKITEILDTAHNSSYFDIECDTPNGIITHVTKYTDTLEDITKDMKDIADSTDIPNSDWEPMDRDMFEKGMRYIHKLMDTQRDDVIQTVNKWYEKIYILGRKNSIKVPRIDTMSDIYKVELYRIIIDFVFKEEDALSIITYNEDNTLEDITGYELRSNIDIDTIKNICMIYKIAKKINPLKRSWRSFEVM